MLKGVLMEEIKQLNRKTDVPKPTDLNYRIGLDIGIASVGWAVLEMIAMMNRSESLIWV